MNTAADHSLVALDQFVSAVYWADDDTTLDDALVEAINNWVASASAEYNDSEPFRNEGHDRGLAASLIDLVAAVEHVRITARPGLTVISALAEALADWSADR